MSNHQSDYQFGHQVIILSRIALFLSGNATGHSSHAWQRRNRKYIIPSKRVNCVCYRSDGLKSG